MLRILLHTLVLPAMLWLDRRHGPHLAPFRGALAWYALGIPLMAVEAAASPGPDRATIFLQSLLVALFFVPPAYFAFRYARNTRSIGKPFLLFIVLAIIAGIAAGLALARAPIVKGFFGTD
ncbi:MAG TPA: hypothetical protein VL283_02800 [Candidatus Baltobacteraceae bacterium]|nr:hypothetical protein [Candidatus Baltobacteraceae bacterium]